MNWNQLRYAVAVAEEGSVTRAAQKLYLAQPSLSLSIKSLEQELGLALFAREQGTLTPTYAGELFVEWAKATLRSYDQLTLKLADIAGERRSLLRVGISPHRSAILMPVILEQFYGAHPECEVRLIEQPTYVLRDYLESGKLDVMVDTPHPDTNAYVSEFLAEEEIVLAVPDSFSCQLSAQLQSAAELPLDALGGFPFILLSQDQVLGSLARQVCEASGFQPNIRLTCVGVENALGLTQKQLGITFVPEFFSAAPQFMDGVRYFHVRGIRPCRQICLVYSRSSYRSQHLQSLFMLFRELAPSIYHISVEPSSSVS